jgi:hypothetical protein
VRPIGVLTLTHSSRETNLERCSVQFLTRRFSDPARLADPPAFDSLAPAPTLYSGAVSFFLAFDDGTGRLHLRRLGSVRSRDRIQHAAVLASGDVMVGFEHRVVRWRSRLPIPELGQINAMDFQVAARFEHPHMAGLHTVDLVGPERVAVACSSPDAILLLDAAEGKLERVLRLPRDLYGRNYELTSGMDLRRHYIPDELQIAHVNAAFADRTGRYLAVSTLIQGAVGVFDLEKGRYDEVTRGFVGCHGARFDDRGNLYFADSTTGNLVTLTEEGKVARRFGTGSRWLHDVQQLRGSIYAFALADANELRVYDIDKDELLFRATFTVWTTEDPDEGDPPVGWLGNSVQGLGWRELGDL